MSSPDLTDSYVAPDTTIPKIGLFTMLRLGVFNMGLGIMSLLTLGVLNRVMIDELKVPALIAAGAIAVHQFMAPARVWIGQMSDSKPLFGYHRSSYIWLGILSMAVTAFVAVQIVWQIGAQIETTGWTSALYPWIGLLGFVFALYGLALSSTSTPFTALLVDVSDEETQSQLVAIGWGMLMLGIVSGVGITASVLEPLGEAPTLDQLRSTINRLFIIAPSIVCFIAILSTFGIEKKYSKLRQRNQKKKEQITLRAAFKVLTASRQTGLFFAFLLVLSLSLFMQDAVLEPYGGQIFGMAIDETTILNAPFGGGTLLGIVGTGLLLSPRPSKEKIVQRLRSIPILGENWFFRKFLAYPLQKIITFFLQIPRLQKKRTIKLGCCWASFCLILLICVGLTHKPMLLFIAVGLFGVSAGVLTTGSILLMLDLTVTEIAGTFIGAWGLAQAIARGTATVLGGGLLSLGKSIIETMAGGPVAESQLLPAYGLVFATQAVGMLIAVAIVSRVNIHEFQVTAKNAIATALESDMD